MEYTDILCPARHHFRDRLSEVQRDVYRSLQARGKELWMYECGYKWGYPPETRLLNHWYDFHNNTDGSGYWAYGDIGDNPSNWNMYPDHRGRGRENYSPLYIDEENIATSRQWEAIREGAENVQYLIMLRERIDALEAEGRTSPDMSRGKELLAVLPSSAQEVEDTRLEVLDMLEKMAGDSASR